MKEIIEKIKQGIYQPYKSDKDDRDIINALEKQIPRKMNPNFNCICCECGNPIYFQTDRLLHHYNYCCECGQRIEWDYI